jgi:hypothetical protein
MYTYFDDACNKMDINEAQPETPDAILVSDKIHLISEVKKMQLGGT